MSFANKTVVITGGSSGIGADAARTFAKLQANVVIVGRNKANLDRVAADCQKKGGKILAIIADMTKDEDVKNIVDKTVKTFGGIDVLINNAGYGTVQKIVDGVDHYDVIMNTNVRSAVLLTHLAIPHLARTKGNIINVSSIAAYRPYFGFNVYCMSKAALDMFTRAAALELGEMGIRVNSINPGATRTNFLHAAGVPSDVGKKAMEKMASEAPLKKVAEGQDIADMMVYLAGPQAKCITGIMVTIDNGAMVQSEVNFQ